MSQRTQTNLQCGICRKASKPTTIVYGYRDCYIETDKQNCPICQKSDQEEITTLTIEINKAIQTFTETQQYRTDAAYWNNLAKVINQEVHAYNENKRPESGAYKIQIQQNHQRFKFKGISGCVCENCKTMYVFQDSDRNCPNCGEQCKNKNNLIEI